MTELGTIFDIREMTTHDGPWVRSTVFFKGCPLRCSWCHNPEGMDPNPQLMIRTKGCVECGACREPCDHADCVGLGRCLHRCPNGLISLSGETVSAEALAERLLRVSGLLDRAGGGYTISGGEPLWQPDFLLRLIELLKPHHVAVETSGHCPQEDFKRVMRLADLMILDVKHMDSARHRAGTGQGNQAILRNLDHLIDSPLHFWVRTPIIPGFNDDEENLHAMAKRLAPAAGRVQVELLHFNPLAAVKYPMVGKSFSPPFKVDDEVKVDLACFRDNGILAYWRPS